MKWFNCSSNGTIANNCQGITLQSNIALSPAGLLFLLARDTDSRPPHSRLITLLLNTQDPGWASITIFTDIFCRKTEINVTLNLKDNFSYSEGFWKLWKFNIYDIIRTGFLLTCETWCVLCWQSEGGGSAAGIISSTRGVTKTWCNASFLRQTSACYIYILFLLNINLWLKNKTFQIPSSHYIRFVGRV